MSLYVALQRSFASSSLPPFCRQPSRDSFQMRSSVTEIIYEHSLAKERTVVSTEIFSETESKPIRDECK